MVVGELVWPKTRLPHESLLKVCKMTALTLKLLLTPSG